MYYKVIVSGLIVIIYLLYFYKSKSRSICKSIAFLMILEMFLNGVITIYNIDYQLREKYDEFIPPELVRKGFAYGILATDEMKARIRGWESRP